MNEKYNSERNLKSKYDTHPFSFDQEAFVKFQENLDRRELQKKAFKWKGPGLILFAVILLSIVYIYSPFLKNESQKTISATAENSEIFSKTTNSSNLKNELENNDIQESDNVQVQDSNKKVGIGESSRESISSSSANLFIHKSSAKNTIEKDIGSSSISFDKLNSGSIDKENKLVLPSLNQREDANLSEFAATNIPDNSVNETQRSKIEFIKAAAIGDLIMIERLNEHRIRIPEDALKPFINPFKKYFYFSLRAGMIINDNFGTNDSYFSILKSKEFSLSGVLAYKFSPDYAVELSYSRQNFSLGFENQEFIYLNKTGDNVSIIKAALVSKLWAPIRNIEFNMTNGIAMMKSRGFSFSKGFSSNITPDFIEAALLDKLALSSNSHYMYSGGIQVNLKLSRNVECTLASEYTVGFNPWSDSRITYIEGEGGSGQNINVSAFSKGSFYAFTFGLKYNLRGK